MIQTPEITEDYEDNVSGTSILFLLDWGKLGEKEKPKSLKEQPIMRLIERYAYEIAAFSGSDLAVELYGKEIPVDGMVDFGKPKSPIRIGF